MWCKGIESDFIIPISLQPNVVDLNYATNTVRSNNLS